MLLVGLLAAELTARHVFGLGDPPLYELDPQVEYLYKPSHEYHRFGHTVAINSHSMRAPEFPARKSDPRELRVMVVGDSIVTGSGKVEQTDLATERLRNRLSDSLKRPVVVGNIAAGSWGPPNQLAFVERFGLFDADCVILVLNSGDVDDVPGLEAIGGTWPQHTPILAIQEPIRRVFERVAPGIAVKIGTLVPAHKVTDDPKRLVSESLKKLVISARLATGEASPEQPRVAAVLYRSLNELGGKSVPRLDELETQLRALRVPVWTTEASPEHPGMTVDPDLFDTGDRVHPSAAGNARLAELFQFVVSKLAADHSK